MNIYEVAKQAVNESSAQKIRPTKDRQFEYDVQPEMFSGNNRGWTLLDLFTASVIVQIYEALNETNRQKYINLPLPKFINLTWKIASK